MKTALFALTIALLGVSGCRERATSMDDGDRPVPMGKYVDDDFVQTRTTFETTVRERLERLDTRIDQLESRTDAAGHDAAIKLRARRDELSSRLDDIGQQTETGWDRFQSEMSRSLDELEHEVDTLVD